MSADDPESRGTISRVSIDARQHWIDIQDSVRQSAIEALKNQLAAAGMPGKYDIFLPHVQAVSPVRSRCKTMKVNVSK